MLTAHGSWDRTQCFSVHTTGEGDRKNHSWGHEDEKCQCPEKSKIELLPLRLVGSFEPPTSVEVWFFMQVPDNALILVLSEKAKG